MSLETPNRLPCGKWATFYNQIMTNLHTTLLSLTIYLAASTSDASVYKCPDGEDKIKFQDAPCTGGTVINIKPSTGIVEPAAPRARVRSQPGASNDPMVGMGKNHLMQTLGQPDSATTTTGYDGAALETMTFMQHGKAITVYLRDGYVFRSSTTERDWIRQQGQQTRNCPSPLEIRNAETSASSITLTKAERRERQRKIMYMKSCLPY
jgi:hypothetical protein